MSSNEHQCKWYRENTYKWMTDDQYECLKMLAELYGGMHHVFGDVKPWGRGIEINTRNGNFATYDYDMLTRAVFLAHDRCIRFEIRPSKSGFLRLVLHKRTGREGRMDERHPTIEHALAQYKARKS